MTRMPWRYRVQNGDLAHVTRERREIIARLRALGEPVRRIADAVDLDERKVREHIRRIFRSGDARCAPRPPGRPRATHAS